MRRKLSEPIEAGADLPELTAQQQNFVSGILSGKTASDAYRASYDCSNMKPNSIWAAASALRANNNVALWLAAARKAGLGTATVTLEGHLAELDRLKEIAIESGNVGAAVQAEQLRGKASGHYVEKMDIKHHDPDGILAELKAISPEWAAQIEKELCEPNAH